MAVPLQSSVVNPNQIKTDGEARESRYVLPLLQIGVATAAIPWPLHLPWSYGLSWMDFSIYSGMSQLSALFHDKNEIPRGTASFVVVEAHARKQQMSPSHSSFLLL